MAENVGSVEIKLLLDREDFDAEFLALSEAPPISQLIKAHLDLDSFYEDLALASGTVGIGIDQKRFNERIANSLADRSLTAKARLDRNDFQNDADRLFSQGGAIRVETELDDRFDDRALNQRIKNATIDRQIRFIGNGDFDAFLSSLGRVASSGDGVGRSIREEFKQTEGVFRNAIVPFVDDSSLTRLNEHLSLKQRHWKEVQDDFSNPIEPKTKLSGNEESKNNGQSVKIGGLKEFGDSIDLVRVRWASLSEALQVVQKVLIDGSSIESASSKLLSFSTDLTNLDSRAGAAIELTAEYLVNTSGLENLFDKTIKQFQSSAPKIGSEIAGIIGKSEVGLNQGFLSSVSFGFLSSIGQKLTGGIGGNGGGGGTAIKKKEAAIEVLEARQKVQKRQEQISRLEEKASTSTPEKSVKLQTEIASARQLLEIDKQRLELAIQRESAARRTSLNSVIETVGQKTEQFVGRNIAKRTVLLSKDLGYKNTKEMFEDVTSIGRGAAQLLDPVAGRKDRQRTIAAASEAAVSYFVEGKPLKQVATGFGRQIMQGQIAQPLEQAKGFAQRGAGMLLRSASPILQINKDIQIAKAAKQAEKMAAEIQISDRKIQEIQQYNGIAYAIGGHHYMEGRGGEEIVKPMLQRAMPGAYVEGVSNKYRDSQKTEAAGINSFLQRVLGDRAPGVTIEGLVKRAGLENVIGGHVLKMVDTAVFSGATPEVIEIAAKTKALRDAGVTAPVSAFGYSAGGADAADFVAISRRLGVETKGVGIGSPVSGIANRRDSGFTTVLGSKDHIYTGLFGTARQKQSTIARLETEVKNAESIADPAERKQAVQRNEDMLASFKDLTGAGAMMQRPIAGSVVVQGAGTAHKLSDYVANPAVIQVLDKALPGVIPQTSEFANQQTRRGLGVAGTRNLDFLDKEATAIKKKNPRDHLSTRSESAHVAVIAAEEAMSVQGERGRDRVRKELAVLESKYKKLAKGLQGRTKDQADAIVGIITEAQAMLEVVEDYNGRPNAQTAAAKQRVQQRISTYKNATTENALQNQQVDFFGDYDKQKYSGIAIESAGKAEKLINQSISSDVSSRVISIEQRINQLGAMAATPQEYELLSGVAKVRSIEGKIRQLKTEAIAPNTSARRSKEIGLQIEELSASIPESAQRVVQAKTAIDGYAVYQQRPQRTLSRIEDAWDSTLPAGAVDSFIVQSIGMGGKSAKPSIDPWETDQERVERVQKERIERRAIQKKQRQEKVDKGIERAKTIGGKIKNAVFDPNRNIDIDVDRVRDGIDATGKALYTGGLAAAKTLDTVATGFKALAASNVGQKVLGAASGTSGAMIATSKAMYKLASAAESVALDMIPMGRSAKGILKQTAVPALAYSAATHMLPGGAAIAGGLEHVATGLLSPVMHSGGAIASGQASSIVSQIIPNVMGMQSAAVSAVTGLIDSAVGGAIAPVASAATAIIGGKVLTGTAGNAVKALPIAATPSQPAIAALLPAAKTQALPPAKPKAIDLAREEVLVREEMAQAEKTQDVERYSAASKKLTAIVTRRNETQRSIPSPVSVEPSVEVLAGMPGLNELTQKQLYAIAKQEGVKGVKSKTNKQELIQAIQRSVPTSKLESILETVDQKFDRTGKPIGGYDKTKESELLKQIKLQEQSINQKLRDARKLSGNDRVNELESIELEANQFIRQLEQLKTQPLSGKTAQTIGATKGRIENTTRNTPEAIEARQNRSAAVRRSQQGPIYGATYAQTVREGDRLGDSTQTIDVAPTRLARAATPSMFGGIKSKAAEFFRSQNISNIATEAIVAGTGIAASTAFSGQGSIASSAASIVGTLTARVAISAGTQYKSAIDKLRKQEEYLNAGIVQKSKMLAAASKEINLSKSGDAITSDVSGFAIAQIAGFAKNTIASSVGVPTIAQLPIDAVAATVLPGKVVDARNRFTQNPVRQLARASEAQRGAGLIERFNPIARLRQFNERRTRRIEEKANSNFDLIYGEMSAESGISQARTPKIVIDDKSLKDQGNDATYDLESNTIRLTRSTAKHLASGTSGLSRKAGALTPVIHEAQHAIQTDGGRLSLEAAANEENIKLRSLAEGDKKRKLVDRSIEFAGGKNAAVRKLEEDAYRREEDAGSILSKVSQSAKPSKIESFIAKSKKVASDSAASFNTAFNSVNNATSGRGVIYKLTQEVGNAVPAIKPFVDQLYAIGSGFAGLAAGQMAIGLLTSFTKKTMEAAIAADRMKTSLAFTTGSKQKGAEAFEYASNQAEKLGIDRTSSIEGYAKLRASAKGKLSASQSNELFEGVASASTTLGLSADNQGGVFLALGQILSKGSVQAEELRGQIGERLPGAFAIAARSMNMTEAQLGKQMELGAVSAEQFVPRFARQMKQEFGPGAAESSQNLQSSVFRVQGQSQRLAEELGTKSAPAMKMGADATAVGLKLLADNAQNLSQAFTAVSVMGGAKLLSTLAAMVPIGPMVAKGFSFLAGAIAPLLAKFLLMNAAIEIGKTLFQSFAPDDMGSRFESQASLIKKSLDEITNKGKAAQSALPANTPSAGFDISAATFGLSKVVGIEKGDDLLKAAKNEKGESILDNGFVRAGMSFIAPMIGLPTELARSVNEANGGTGLATMQEVQFNRSKIALGNQGDQIYNATGSVFDSLPELKRNAAIAQSEQKLIDEKQAERNRLASTANPDKARLAKIDEEIKASAAKRDKASEGFGDRRNIVESNIASLKAQKDALKDSKDYTPEQKKELESSLNLQLSQLESAKKQLDAIDKKFGGSADIMGRFNMALSEMSAKLEEVTAKAKNAFNQSEVKRLEGKKAGRLTDEFATQSTAIQQAQNEQAKASAEYSGTKKTIAEVDKMIDDPTVQRELSKIAINGKSIDKETSAQQLERAKAGRSEAEKAQIDKLITRRKAIDSLPELKKAELEAEDKTFNAKSALELERLDRGTKVRELENKEMESGAQARFAKDQLGSKVNERDVSVRQSEISKVAADLQVGSIKESVQGLDELLKQGKISKEEYTKRSMDLRSQLADATTKAAQAELAVEQAKNKRLLDLWEENINKRKVSRKETEGAQSIGLIKSQMGGRMNESDVAIKKAELQSVSAKGDVGEVKKQMAEVDQLRSKGVITEQEHTKRKLDLRSQLVDANIKAAEAELAIEQAKNRKILNDWERTIKARELANKRSETGATIGLIQAQRGNRMGEDDVAIKRAEIQGLSANNSLSSLSSQLSELDSLRARGVLTEEEHAKRRMDLESSVLDAKVKAAEAELAIEQAKNRKIINEIDKVKQAKLFNLDQSQGYADIDAKYAQLNGGRVGMGGESGARERAIAATKEKIAIVDDSINKDYELRNAGTLSDKEFTDRTQAGESTLRSEEEKLVNLLIQQRQALYQEEHDNFARANNAIIRGLESRKTRSGLASQLDASKQAFAESAIGLGKAKAENAIARIETTKPEGKDRDAEIANVRLQSLMAVQQAEMAILALKERQQQAALKQAEIEAQIAYGKQRIAVSDSERKLKDAVLTGDQNAIANASEEVKSQRELLGLEGEKLNTIGMQNQLATVKMSIDRQATTIGMETDLMRARAAVGTGAGRSTGTQIQQNKVIGGGSFIGGGGGFTPGNYNLGIDLSALNSIGAQNAIKPITVEPLAAKIQPSVSSVDRTVDRSAAPVILDDKNIVQAINRLGEQLGRIAPQRERSQPQKKAPGYSDYLEAEVANTFARS